MNQVDASNISERCRNLLLEIGVVEPDEKITVQSLTGGVASDIAKVTVNARTVCVKFALPKLKVSADWFAPVHRNGAEYAWLTCAADIVPDNSIDLFGKSDQLHGFAMEYLAGDSTYLWKSSLLAEARDNGETEAVGHVLGKIHSASTRNGFDTTPFNNHDDFNALRLEPYL